MTLWPFLTVLNAFACLLNAGLVAGFDDRMAFVPAGLSAAVVVAGIYLIADRAWPHRSGDGRHA